MYRMDDVRLVYIVCCEVGVLCECGIIVRVDIVHWHTKYSISKN